MTLITGTKTANVLYSTAGDDQLLGLGGNDRLSSGGNDILNGGAGKIITDYRKSSVVILLVN